MKIAISTDGDSVSAHFGRCPSFTLVDIKDGKVTSKEVIDNPGHHPGFLPDFLGQKGANYIIAGGMGQRARMLFEEKKIIPILGVESLVDEAVARFLNDNLISDDKPCEPRSGKGYGLDKTECDHAHE